jgi:hypothetical protein
MCFEVSLNNEGSPEPAIITGILAACLKAAPAYKQEQSRSAGNILFFICNN